MGGDGGDGGGLVAKSCPTLVTSCTVAFQAPLSTGILQARILKWVAISFYSLMEGGEIKVNTGDRG